MAVDALNGQVNWTFLCAFSPDGRVLAAAPPTAFDRAVIRHPLNVNLPQDTFAIAANGAFAVPQQPLGTVDGFTGFNIFDSHGNPLGTYSMIAYEENGYVSTNMLNRYSPQPGALDVTTRRICVASAMSLACPDTIRSLPTSDRQTRLSGKAWLMSLSRDL